MKMMTENEKQISKDKHRKNFLIIYIVVLLILGFSLEYFVISTLKDSQYQTTLDEYFQLQYSSTVADEGEQIISSMVNESSEFTNESEKINKIADLVTQNFTELYFSETTTNLFPNECGGNVALNHRYFGNLCGGYGYDKNGKIRAKGVSLSHNATWIAYHKTGACEELAVLFTAISNRSGFLSRSVCPEGLDHQWNEISADGKEWKYVDLTKFHDLKGNLTYQQYWFDNPSNYHNNTGYNFLGVYICYTNKTSPENNLSLNYDYDRSQYEILNQNQLNLNKKINLNNSELKIPNITINLVSFFQRG